MYCTTCIRKPLWRFAIDLNSTSKFINGLINSKIVRVNFKLVHSVATVFSLSEAWDRRKNFRVAGGGGTHWQMQKKVVIRESSEPMNVPLRRVPVWSGGETIYHKFWGKIWHFRSSQRVFEFLIVSSHDATILKHVHSPKIWAIFLPCF